jgi:DNA polymerase-3 subunit gamma/tau
MRDAISLLEQVAVFSGEQITLHDAIEVTGGLGVEHFNALAQALASGKVTQALTVAEELSAAGKSADKCLENLLYYFRDLLVIQLTPGQEGKTHLQTERILNAEQVHTILTAFTPEHIFRIIDILSNYLQEIRQASLPQTILEVALMKICTLAQPGAFVDLSAKLGFSIESTAPTVVETSAEPVSTRTTQQPNGSDVLSTSSTDLMPSAPSDAHLPTLLPSASQTVIDEITERISVM